MSNNKLNLFQSYMNTHISALVDANSQAAKKSAENNGLFTEADSKINGQEKYQMANYIELLTQGQDELEKLKRSVEFDSNGDGTKDSVREFLYNDDGNIDKTTKHSYAKDEKIFSTLEKYYNSDGSLKSAKNIFDIEGDGVSYLSMENTYDKDGRVVNKKSDN
ncbi:hypothetical protein IJ425_04510 [bacterium]|nr:hypothetical protein [bacterium]